MGMDIAFSRSEALTAGLEVVKMPNWEMNDYSPLQVAEFAATDQLFHEWLVKEGEYVVVPGLGTCVENAGLDRIVIRANKWGRVYEPMTNWLKSKGITWSEY